MVFFKLEDPRDIEFSKIAQNVRIDGAILPSGLKIPNIPGKMWIIIGEYIHYCSKPVVEDKNDEPE